MGYHEIKGKYIKIIDFWFVINVTFIYKNYEILNILLFQTLSEIMAEYFVRKFIKFINLCLYKKCKNRQIFKMICFLLFSSFSLSFKGISKGLHELIKSRLFWKCSLES